MLKSNHFVVLVDSFAAVHVSPGMEHGEFTEYASSGLGSRAYAPDAPREEGETLKIVALEPKPIR